MVVLSLNPIVSLILAVIILKESLTWVMVPGILLLLLGPVLIASREQRSPLRHPPSNLRERMWIAIPLQRDVLRCRGSFVLGKQCHLHQTGSLQRRIPLAGSFIAHVAASLAILPSSLLNKQTRMELLQKDSASLRLAILSGLTSCTAKR